jgi:hypothetical protein
MYSMCMYIVTWTVLALCSALRRLLEVVLCWAARRYITALCRTAIGIVMGQWRTYVNFSRVGVGMSSLLSRAEVRRVVMVALYDFVCALVRGQQRVWGWLYTVQFSETQVKHARGDS